MGNGMSLWVPLISAGAALIGALGSQWLSHLLATKREKRAAEEKLKREQYFIATELVFLLEKFAQDCISPATCLADFDDKGRVVLLHKLPNFDYKTVTGDWRSLPGDLLYSLSEFPVVHEESRRHIEAAEDNDDPFDGSATISAIRSQSSSLGVRAIRLSRQLRKLCEMPPDDLAKYRWSAWNVLFKVYKGGIDAFVNEVRSSQHAAAAASIRSEVSSGERM